MNSLIIYMLKAGAYIVAFYVVYALMLSRDTLYGRNRTFIIVSLTLAMILPAFTMMTPRPLEIQNFGRLLEEVFISGSSGSGSSAPENVLSPPMVPVLCYIYCAGVLLLLGRLLVNMANIGFLVYRYRQAGSRIIRFHGSGTAGFSALGYIFINDSLQGTAEASVIRHEQNHLRKNHFFDILYVEIIKALQWFNPALHLFDRSLRAVHEFQADQECLSSGITVSSYQSLLLNQVFRTSGISLTNSFSNPSLVKRRMIMMTKKRSSALADIKLLGVIPAAMLVFFAISAYREIPEPSMQERVAARTEANFSEPESKTATVDSHNKDAYQALPLPENRQPEGTLAAAAKSATITKSRETADSPPPPPPPPSVMPGEKTVIKGEMLTSGGRAPFVVVEEMPMFPGGDVALLKYIGENVVYPEAAKAGRIQGRVIIRFCVTETGEIDLISILKGVSPELDAEASRVVSTLPRFSPGRQGGKDVPVWYSVPITFTLK